MITFGRFGHVEDTKKEKEYFLECLDSLMIEMSSFEDKNKYSETEIIKPLKELMKREVNSSLFHWTYCKSLSYFLNKMGLSYFTLTPKEKEEVLDMDFTYENWKTKSFELIQSFLKRSKNACPQMVWFCFEDIYFVFHVQVTYDTEFKSNNFITFIRDYYILENTVEDYKKYRNQEKYNEIRKKVFEIYPIIKERYGMNRIFDKILSFFNYNNDYNYEETKNLLDNYYNKNNKIKDDETINLKEKQN